MKNKTKQKLPHLHLNKPAFQAALEFTARNTGFRQDLIEKDFFCSLVLDYIYSQSGGDLVFKGGTCLNKVHVGFYRLSEDLDFSVPIPFDAKRTVRQKAAEPLKELMSKVGKELPDFEIITPLKGSNESRQYNAELQYRSITGQPGTIRIEIGLREPLIEKLHEGAASTLLQDPFTSDAALPSFEVKCLAPIEAYAEKMRAALARRIPAIRDYFDIDHAATTQQFNFKSSSFLEVLRKKILVQAIDPNMDVSSKKRLLQDQLERELGPVLREQDFKEFRLDRAMDLVNEVAVKLRQLKK